MRPPSRHARSTLSTLRALRHDPGLSRAYRLGLVWGWRERRRIREAERFVLFVGHGFSGHSLVGSLLDAHPDAVVSHELDVLRHLQLGLRRRQLLGLIRYRQQAWGAQGRVQNSYSYVVPGQWQGRVRRMTVVGDKKGGETTWQLAGSPELLEQLRDELRLPLRVVHVTRSPLDNIGSMVRTMGYAPAEAVAIWRRQVETCTWLHGRLAPDELHLLSTEDVRRQPVEQLRELCAFLGLATDDAYLRDCAALVDPEPSRSRSAFVWPAELVDEVMGVVAAHPWLHAYLDDHAQSWPSSAASASSSVPA